MICCPLHLECISPSNSYSSLKVQTMREWLLKSLSEAMIWFGSFSSAPTTPTTCLYYVLPTLHHNWFAWLFSTVKATWGSTWAWWCLELLAQCLEHNGRPIKVMTQKGVEQFLGREATEIMDWLYKNNEVGPCSGILTLGKDLDTSKKPTSKEF